MDKYNVIYSCSGLLHSYQKEQIADSNNSINKPLKLPIGTISKRYKEYILGGSTFINLKDSSNSLC